MILGFEMYIKYKCVRFPIFTSNENEQMVDFCLRHDYNYTTQRFKCINDLIKWLKETPTL